MATTKTEPNSTPNTVAPDADELDAILGGADAALDADLGGELGDIDLAGYDLSSVHGLDIRPLKHRAWYDADIINCAPGTSGNGNPQFEFLLRVVGCVGDADDRDAEGNPTVGVTVFDQAPTPRPPLTPKKLQSLWKIKAIAKATGLAELNSKGEVVRIKPGTKAEHFIGKRVRFRNTVDEVYDPNNPRNKPDTYLPCPAGA